MACRFAATSAAGSTGLSASPGSQTGGGAYFIPLCQPCAEAPDQTSEAITQRYFRVREMKFSHGGDIVNMVAMEEKRGATEH
jgi:hypothetical protein